MSLLDTLCINTIRMLSADAVQAARSGHPGMPMGAASMAYVLWTRFLKHNPANPRWTDRDRFVLSAGHGSMLLYSLLHLTGYDLPIGELRSFRQWGAKTAGHPEYGLVPGVEVTTGPLGQGLAHAVGMAMAERFLAARFNRPGHEVVGHHTYVLVGDGDLMEGLSHEAASLAGHLRLGKLICLFDDNRITIEGPTALATSDDPRRRFEAYGWQVLEVDGNDLGAVSVAIEGAKAQEETPTLIAARTHIGHGSPNKQDKASSHGAPLGDEELRLTKEALGWPPEPTFHVPEEVSRHMREAMERGEAWEREWQARLTAYTRSFPAESALFTRWQAGELPAGWEVSLLATNDGGEASATRSVSGRAIQVLADQLGNLVGGSADLGPSNNTAIKDAGAFVPGRVEGPNVHFGVREHAMAAAVNGMALHGGLRPYGGTFLVFSDYMRPSLRLAAMMGTPSIFVFTHDSIGVGEDGPTHQPIEHIAALRAIPGLTVIRPADARETLEAWQVAIARGKPTALVLTRQKLPALSRVRMPAEGAVAQGAYVLTETSASGDDRAADGHPRLVLIGTGSEVQVCLQAQKRLEGKGIATRVVSMPSWELFEEQPASYQRSVLPPGSVRLAVEAASPFGWERYTGRSDAIVGMERFGASAPADVLFEKFGFTAENVTARAMDLLTP